MKKSTKIIIIVILLFVELIIINFSFAWFNTVVKGNAGAKTFTVRAAELEITYVDGPELNVPNIVPGWTGTKTFTVTNTGEAATSYKIAWKEIKNNFVNRDDLVYSVSSTNSGGNLGQTQFPNSENHVLMIDNITIGQGVTQTYTITIQYLNTVYNQVSDKTKNLTGTIEILDLHDTTINPQTSAGNELYTVNGQTLSYLTKNELMQYARADFFNTIYSVNSIYVSESSTNPSTLFGGTWEPYGAGKALVGIDENDADFSTIKTGGEKTHTLTVAEMPSHNHTYTYSNRGSFTESGSTNTQYQHAGYSTNDSGATGESGAHNNLQPYQVVYMWIRTE